MGLLLLMTPAAQAGPADWGESDWYKYFDATVGLAAGEAYSGAKVFPKGVGGRFPVVDVYSALGGMSAAVKPGLLSWLSKKMRDAVAAGDYNRLDGYQAYHTALATGDMEPLKKVQKRAQKAIDDARRKAADIPGLTLQKVFGAANGRREVEVTFQFVVDGNREGRLKNLSYEGEVSGPGTSVPLRGSFRLTRNTGYQASGAYCQLPHGAASGRYRVRARLTGAGGLRTRIATASFDYRAPGSKASDPKEEEPKEEEPSEPISSGSLDVRIQGDMEIEVDDTLSLRPLIKGGTPPYKVTWRSPAGTMDAPVIEVEAPSPVDDDLAVTVTDSKGRIGKDTRRLRVYPKLKAKIRGPKHVASGSEAYYRHEVKGGKGRTRHAWSTSRSRGWADTEPLYLKGSLTSLGERKILLKIWDEGLYKNEPKMFERTIEVHEPLTASLVGPTTVKADQDFQVKLVTAGGYGRQSQHWKTRGDGRQREDVPANGSGNVMPARLSKPGQDFVEVKVWDRTTPKDKPVIARLDLTVTGGEGGGSAPSGSVSRSQLVGRYFVSNSRNPGRNTIVLKADGTATHQVVGFTWSSSAKWSYKNGVFSFSKSGWAEYHQGRVELTGNGFQSQGHYNWTQDGSKLAETLTFHRQ